MKGEPAIHQIGGYTAQSRKFALLSYVGTQNLGDEIQSIAAQRFLPRVDAWLDRERLDEFRADAPHKIILNGWFLHRPDHWPPSPSLEPLIISFHLTREIVPSVNVKRIPPSTTVLRGEGLDFLRRHEPIGARDLGTLAELQSAGVASYFSGCLTLTLPMTEPNVKRERVYAVDVSDAVFDCLSRRCGEPVVRLSHGDSELVGSARFAKAARLLQHYAGARAVVTSRLHCALPCLAFGTPVLLIDKAADRYRFAGLRDFLHCTSEADILSGHCNYNLSRPPDNKDGWQPLRTALEARCRSFIGEGGEAAANQAAPALP
jgi:polysaccharide pyruvyl transferase